MKPAARARQARIVWAHETSKRFRESNLAENSLRVNGMRLDRLARLSSIWNLDNADDISVWTPDVQDMVNSEHFPYTAGDRREAMKYTLVAGRDIENRPATVEQLDQYDVWMQAGPDTAKVVLQRFDKLSPDQEKKATAFEYVTRQLTSVRRFFTTFNGEMGLGPKVMEKGDVVAALYQHRWPVVLRPWGCRFIFVGNCHIHGIMYGEAFQVNQEARHTDELFII